MSLCPASRDQAREVLPEPEAQTWGQVSALLTCGRRNAVGLASQPQEGPVSSADLRSQDWFQPLVPSSSSSPPQSRPRFAPIGQQSQPSTNTVSSYSLGCRGLKERRSHWLVLRKLVRRDRARVELVQLVKSCGQSSSVQPPNRRAGEGFYRSLFELSGGRKVRKRFLGTF